MICQGAELLIQIRNDANRPSWEEIRVNANYVNSMQQCKLYGEKQKTGVFVDIKKEEKKKASLQSEEAKEL